MSKPYISYIDPATMKDAAMLAELEQPETSHRRRALTRSTSQPSTSRARRSTSNARTWIAQWRCTSRRTDP